MGSDEAAAVSPGAMERLERVDTVVSAEVGEDLVMLDLKSATYYTVNAVGARIWSLIENGRSLHELTAVLLAEFDVEESHLRDDVDRFARQMSRLGLARLVSS